MIGSPFADDHYLEESFYLRRSGEEKKTDYLVAR